ncbi:transmembrane emp24 domain-containing protein 7 [Plakobranchus ocellatus]|uniref:Transmembrane emp24 domain-containing protein 7 n=1 Tax=Plakobranchus ocellatus TaxID=259542 RepID=A0AAV3Z0K5_9GAST|nr:transmembrane emp24 domain-containing protein 7 [Plakobranchus ocellatus]
MFAVQAVFGGELTFELPDNDRMCFYENVDKGVQATLEFQVITGGNYDVDLELTAPNGQVLYKDIKKQYDSFTWTAQYQGIHTFCFSNEFSTFTHKVVYFDIEVGDEKPAVEEMGEHHTAMTLMETSSVNVFESLKSVIDYQTHHRLREAQGRGFAEDLNERVLYWSVRTKRKRQATFLGHVMRSGKLEHLVTTGKFAGKRSRGRQREKIMDGLATWLGTGKVPDIILAAVKDRGLWKDMIANTYKQGT